MQLPQDVPRDLYPFPSHHAEVNGFAMHYLDEGQGEVVVMLHGNPTWSFYYRNLVLALRDRGYRCIVPDHIGCGLSERPAAHDYPFTFERRAEDVEALLTHLGIHGPVTLVLHDWGGMIGMLWAHRHPGQVRRLVLLNTAAFHLPSSKPFPWQLWLARDTGVGAVLVDRFNAFAEGAARTACTRKPLSRTLRRAYTAPYRRRADRLATLRFVQDIPLRPDDPGYTTISEVEATLPRFAPLPIFLGWGLRDFVFDRHFLQRWQDLYPHATSLVVPEAGHYILEDADDLMIPAITDFLAEHPLEERPPEPSP